MKGETHMSTQKKKIGVLMSLIICIVLALVALSPSGIAADTVLPTGQAATSSNAPTVNPDGTVTFTLEGPDANEVILNWQNMVGPSPRADPYPMTKDTDGVWSITMGPLDPNWYGYNFTIDGVQVADPANRDIWSGSRSAWSYVFVPGPEADFMADALVPHGAVATVRYFSNIEQTQRQMQVYTPPGYNHDNRRYPVLYLLHGGGGNDTDWIVNMRANYILDNLIAQGEIVPMIVVMPDDYVAGANYLRDFPEELMGSIVPAIEENYRVAPGPKNRSLAGLSRGGRCTMATLVKYPGYFAYIGSFGAEYTVTADYPVELLDNPAINEGTKLLLITVGGPEDISYNRTHATLALLDEHGVNYTFVQRTGGHVWDIWRHDLYDFAPLLFQ
jgi:enterochelin esterase-like enzyme